MKYHPLAHTDFQISEIAFGAWAIVGGFNWGHQDEKDSLEALRAAYESGINFFDTAELYGSGASENLICKALGDVMDKIIVATKIKPQDFAYEQVKKATEERLKALKTDTIDLMQLHWPNHNVSLAETLGALEDLKKEGKIRAFGVSNFGAKDLKEAFSLTNQLVSNQLPYNLLWRAIEFEILPECRSADLSVLCYSPLMQGLLTGKFTSPDEVPEDRARTRHFSSDRPQTRHGEAGAEAATFEAIARLRKIAAEAGMPMGQMSLSWLLAQQGVGSVIVGGRNAQQVKSNVQAAELKLSDELLSALDEATRPLKDQLGPNPDLWQGESRYR
ncbi:MAG: aldo/keto reductase [Cyclobacteriaceae bacterium]